MKQRRQVITAGSAVFTILFLLFYVLPRQRQMAAAEKEIAAIREAQGTAAHLIPEAVEQAGPISPNPTLPVSGWLTTHVLNGLEKRLSKNDPYRSGQGTILELRALKPMEVSSLLSQMTQVNLLVKGLAISDFNGRGVWDVKTSVEMPAAAASAAPSASPTPGEKP